MTTVPREPDPHGLAPENRTFPDLEMRTTKPVVGENEYEENILKRAGGLRDHLLGYVSNVGLVIWLLSYCFADNALRIPLWQFVAGGAAGLFTWTFVEYWMHRGPYHHSPKATRVGHDLHHRFPKALIGIPYYVTLVAMVGIFFALRLLFDEVWLALIMAFVWTGYIGYTLIHHASHQLSPSNKLFAHIRKHHLIHHGRPDVNFGFLTTFWDRVFRTLFVPGTRKAY